MLRTSLRLVTFVTALLLLSLVSPCWAGNLIGDLNNDGRVDINDAQAMVETYGSEAEGTYWNPYADLISNGVIDIYDVVLLARRFGMFIPVASFLQSAEVANVGTPIEFDPSGSFDPDGEIILYEWDVDSDGTYESSADSASALSHTYLEPGTFNVTLKVTDNDMLTDTDTKRITVTMNNVVPEVPLGTVVASAAMITALIGYIMLPRLRKNKQFSKGSII